MEKVPQLQKKVRIAMTGCIHGQLRKLYTDLQEYEQSSKKKIDLVLCSGDFECFKSKDDLPYMECPERYRHVGDFPSYYEGKYPVPYLTIFIGGNHEASNILHENFYGGWIMERIYYLGRAGVIKTKGIRIAGSSGIFKENSYLKGHFEEDLLKNNRSIYHLREYEVAKLSRLTGKIDIMISHDWPTGIVDKRDFNKICKIKRGWKNELETNTLGSYPNEFLLSHLKPDNWLCGHMHYTYSNQIDHSDGSKTTVYALDKCIKNRPYYEVIEFDVDDNAMDDSVYVDGQWIQITQVFNDYFPTKHGIYSFSANIPNEEEYNDTIGGINFITGKNVTKVIIPKERLESITTMKNDDVLVETYEDQAAYMKNDIFKIGSQTIVSDSNAKNNEEIDLNFDM